MGKDKSGREGGREEERRSDRELHHRNDGRTAKEGGRRKLSAGIVLLYVYKQKCSFLYFIPFLLGIVEIM